MAPPPSPAGVIPALVVFYKENEDLDFISIKKHITRLAQAGSSGLLVQGDNGEAPLLSDQERIDIIKLTRQTLNELNLEHVPVIAGASSVSIRGTIKLCKDAKEAGASYALVLPVVPWPLTMSITRERAVEDYLKVADASPLPIIIYNFPSVVSGVNFDSDDVLRLAQHPNIVGVKFADDSIGKLHRVCAQLAQSSNTEFAVYTSGVDNLAHGLLSGCSGAMAAFPNIAPKLTIQLYNLFKNGQIKEALELETKLNLAEWSSTRIGKLSSLKSVVAKYFGYGSPIVRAPLPPVSVERLSASAHVQAVEEVVALEQSS